MQQANTPEKIAEDRALCAECGKAFPRADLLTFGNRYICAGCKPAFQQKIAEGAYAPGDLTYGGVRRRFLALFIDGILTWVAMGALGLVAMAASGTDFMVAIGSSLMSFGGSIFGVVYSVVMIGKYGATLGKMAMGLKVVRPDGSSFGYGLATGRYFAQFLNVFTFGIGYLMAIWDKEKRGLHDRVCGTRVIRT